VVEAPTAAILAAAPALFETVRGYLRAAALPGASDSPELRYQAIDQVVGLSRTLGPGFDDELRRVPELVPLGLDRIIDDILATARGLPLVGAVAQAYAEKSEAEAACGKCGRDSCAGPNECGAAPKSPGPASRPAPDNRPRFRAAIDVMGEAPPLEVVEGLAGAGRVGLLVGESGAGKSFVALSMLSAQADGAPWCGRSTTRGSVAVVAFEQDAIGERLRAAQDQGHSLADFYVLRADEPLSPRVSGDGIEAPSPGEAFVAGRLQYLAHDLAAQGRPPIVHVVVDTVRQSMAGPEESSEAVSAYLRAARRAVSTAAPGAALTLLHHSGWQDGEQKKRRERGSSAFRGNVDYVHYLELAEPDAEDTSEVRLVLRTLKSRDGERRAPLFLIRRRVDLGSLDQYGNARTSCVIVADPRSRQDREAEAAAELEAQERADGLEMLHVIAARPEATSAEDLRAAAGWGKPRAAAALSRLVLLGWVRRGGRGRPFQVLQAGAEALNQQRDRTGPNGTRDSLGPAGSDTGPGTLPVGESGSAVLFAGGPGGAERPERDRTV
jgi:hypothetical protein